MKRLGWTGAPFSTQIAKPGALAALVNNAATASKMAAAYVDAVGTKSASNKNRTSMCVYAGPDPASSYWPAASGAHPFAAGGPVGSLGRLDPLEIGWLGTGDAELKRNKWSKPFLAHYHAQIGRTFTVLVPHHGSQHNFSNRLLDLEPRYGVASAWPRNPAWLHPHDDVRKAVEALPATFKHVTETDAFEEQFLVFL